jgi:hypothetical protein
MPMPVAAYVCSNPHPQPTPHSNSWGVQLAWHPCRVLAPPDVRAQEPMQQLQPASAVHQVACSRQGPCHWQSLLCLPAAPSCFGMDHPATLCCQACQPYFTVQHSSCSPVPRPLRVPVHCLLESLLGQGYSLPAVPAQAVGPCAALSEASAVPTTDRAAWLWHRAELSAHFRPASAADMAIWTK